MTIDVNFKYYFLRFFIAALSLSALIGMYIFLFGKFEETENQLLGTALLIAVYSIIGLCSASIIHRKGLKGFSITGMLIAAILFVYSVLVIWEIVYFKNNFIFITIPLVIAVSTALISLMFLPKFKSWKIRLVRSVTIVLILVVAFVTIKYIILIMIIYLFV